MTPAREVRMRGTGGGSAVHDQVAFSLNAVKLIRLRDTLAALDAESSQGAPDEAARMRVNAETQRLLVEVGTALPQPLLDELKHFIVGVGAQSTDSEWRLVRGQLIGWLDGIFWALEPVGPDPGAPDADPEAEPEGGG